MDNQIAADRLFGSTSKPQGVSSETLPSAPTAPIKPVQDASDSNGPTKTAADILFGGGAAGPPYKSPFDKGAIESNRQPEGEQPKEAPKPEEAANAADANANAADVVAVATEQGYAADDPLTMEFGEIAASLGKDKAAQLLSLQQRASEQAWQQLSDSWKEQALASPTFNQDLAAAKDVLAAHATPELKEFLNAYHAGNHPAVIKFLGSVGRALKGRR